MRDHFTTLLGLAELPKEDQPTAVQKAVEQQAAAGRKPKSTVSAKVSAASSTGKFLRLALAQTPKQQAQAVINALGKKQALQLARAITATRRGNRSSASP